MKSFALYNPTSLKEAVDLLGADPAHAQLLAGGMDLLSRLKKRLDTPERVVNLKSIPGLEAVRETGKGVSVGPLVRLTDLTEHSLLWSKYRAVGEAAASVGSEQIRNAGTVGGNLCQRPRCWYFRHHDYPCLQKGGATCFAVAGENRYHAILDGGPCFFAHPSDLAPALMVFDATVRLVGPGGERTISLEKLYTVPRERMNAGLTLEPGEILAEIRLPEPAAGTRSAYYKFKEKPSFDFSLVGVAVALAFADGKIAQARLALSGVAPVPWRALEAEKSLLNMRLDEGAARQAAEAAVANAAPLSRNRYKIALTRTIVRRTLLGLA